MERIWKSARAVVEKLRQDTPRNIREEVSNVPSVVFGRWEISVDVDSTRKAYASVLSGGSEECGCGLCLNFAAARDQIYPADVLALFEKLGIPPNREVEIYHMARLASGKHLYGGWFHFVGSILSGAEAARQIAENLWQPDLERISGNFNLGFSSRLALARRPFVGFPLVQLEFNAEVPWVLTTPEPK